MHPIRELYTNIDCPISAHAGELFGEAGLPFRDRPAREWMRAAGLVPMLIVGSERFVGIPDILRYIRLECRRNHEREMMADGSMDD